MDHNTSKYNKIVFIAGGILITSLYLSSDKKESEPTPVSNLPVSLPEGSYNGICAGLLSIENKIDFRDVVFRKFYLPSSPTVNVSHGKNYYECKFIDDLVTFRTSKDNGKTYSDWVNKSDLAFTYRFKKSLSERLVNVVVIDSQGKEKLMNFDKVTVANVALDAKQIQNEEFNKVCQHTIALEFSKTPKTVKLKEPYKAGYNSIKVGYVRPVDNTTWNFECQVNEYDNKIIWRTMPGSNVSDMGRWRDGSNGFDRDDSTVKYTVLKDVIEVRLTYPDGSGSTSKIKRT